MQVNQIYTSQEQTAKTYSSKSRTQQGEFAREFETASMKSGKAAAASEQDRISLGKISSDQPSVSHLMVNHPDYEQECWDIIHSEQNRNKPYTRIPSGTEIFLNPETEEISWQGDNRTHCNYTAAGSRNRVDLSIDNESEVIRESISRAASKHNLSGRLIECVIRAESGFDPFAVSRAGAQGLMQLMPDTARELGVEDPFNIRENIDAGARYLKKMLDDFGGSLEKALAAYNAGPGAVKRFAGNVPYAETREYVERVLSFLSPQ